MMTYNEISKILVKQPSTWVVTGCAGFIGSHLLERLLNLNQNVIGIDNFSTGFKANLDKVSQIVGPEKFKNFRFHHLDICDPEAISPLVLEADYILHQAAIGSVPRSIAEPIHSHRSNVDGFFQLLLSAKESKRFKRIVYASSSSVYGSDSSEYKTEAVTGDLLSPYALTKKTNELYADVFARTYNFKAVGLRYFNVFGPRQNPQGAYAAVIPRWIEAIKGHLPMTVFGDGSTSRDFCYVENIIQANILAAVNDLTSNHQVFNVALHRTTSLNELLHTLIEISGESRDSFKITHTDFRQGDIYKSCADISLIKNLLGYQPAVFIQEGLEKTFVSY
jgi:UDP-N-acetylglucosamine/UDP-N-acetylgalactosamine 4-epimerase